MPGKILIIDPIVTNRVVRKAQLVAEYFSVDLAADLTSARKRMTKSLPDIFLLNYDAEEKTGFATVKSIRTDPRLAHLPIVLLCLNVEDMFWANCYRLGVEEILPTLPDAKLLSNRLSQMIRRKKTFEEQRARQRTYADMGFAEDRICFPPQFPPALIIDCTHALRVMASAGAGDLEALLKQSFPAVNISTTSSHNTVVQVIDSAQVGHEHALQLLSETQRNQDTTKGAAKLLYVADSRDLEVHRRALELGADDYIVAPFSQAELASRIRRLAWLHQMEAQAEQRVDDHLRLAMLDPMTGLHNRRYALQYLENMARKPGSAGRSITVMMLDLDNFKSINDNFGHQTGDAVICETAKRLKRSLRSADLVARVGGEEFLVVLNDTPFHQASSIAARMCDRINDGHFQPDMGQQPFKVSISIGVAFAKTNKFPPAELIGLADRALYLSKDQGRNCVTVLPIAA